MIEHYLDITSRTQWPNLCNKTLPIIFYHCFGLLSTFFVQLKIKNSQKNKKFKSFRKIFWRKGQNLMPQCFYAVISSVTDIKHLAMYRHLVQKCWTCHTYLEWFSSVLLRSVNWIKTHWLLQCLFPRLKNCFMCIDNPILFVAECSWLSIRKNNEKLLLFSSF